MPPAEPTAGPKTIVDHTATQTPGSAIGRITNLNTDGDTGLPDDVIAPFICNHPAEQPKAPQKPPQATQQPSEPIKPEVVWEVFVEVFNQRQMLRVGRLYLLTPEGFDEVDE